MCDMLNCLLKLHAKPRHKQLLSILLTEEHMEQYKSNFLPIAQLMEKVAENTGAFVSNLNRMVTESENLIINKLEGELSKEVRGQGHIEDEYYDEDEDKLDVEKEEKEEEEVADEEDYEEFSDAEVERIREARRKKDIEEVTKNVEEDMFISNLIRIMVDTTLESSMPKLNIVEVNNEEHRERGEGPSKKYDKEEEVERDEGMQVEEEKVEGERRDVKWIEMKKHKLSEYGTVMGTEMEVEMKKLKMTEEEERVEREKRVVKWIEAKKHKLSEYDKDMETKMAGEMKKLKVTEDSTFSKEKVEREKRDVKSIEAKKHKLSKYEENMIIIEDDITVEKKKLKMTKSDQDTVEGEKKVEKSEDEVERMDTDEDDEEDEEEGEIIYISRVLPRDEY